MDWRAFFAAGVLAVGLMVTSTALKGDGDTPPGNPKAETTPDTAQTPDTSAAPGGVLRPEREYRLRINMKAYTGTLVVAELAAAGSWIKEGEVVARLESDDYMRTVERARSARERAELAERLAQVEFELGREGAKDALMAAEQESELSRSELEAFDRYGQEHALRSAEIERLRIEAGIEEAQQELAQLEKLYKGEELSEESQEIVLERARRNIDLMARKRDLLIVDFEELRSIRLPRQHFALRRSAQAARDTLAKLKASLGDNGHPATQMGWLEAKAALERANTELTQLMADKEQFILRAPVDGIVVIGGLEGNNGFASAYRKGDEIAAGTLVATVMDDRRLEVIASVPLAQLTSFSEGTPVTVRCSVDTGKTPGQSAAGKVETVSPLVSEGKVAIRVSVDNAQHQLKIGMDASVERSQ